MTSSPSESQNSRGPLEGIRVLDFSRFLSGPHCTRALSDLGADVVKVESPDGDFTQNIPPHSGVFSRFYVQQNAGKRNVCLDLRRPGATELVQKLIPHFDVVVENFRPGVMRSMGLDYESCRAVNPRLVYVSITGWGQDGPESQRQAFATLIHAESGITARQLNLHPSDQPVSDEFSHADVYSGLEALAGALAALYQREKTGIGQHVDIAMMSTALSVNEHANTGLDPTWPIDHVNRSSIFRYRETFIALVADPVEPISFGRLAKAMDQPHLGEDPRFTDESARSQHRKELIDLIQEWISGFATMTALEQRLSDQYIPVGVVRTVRDVATSPWAAHRRAVVEVSDRQGGTVSIPNAPWIFSASEVGVRNGPSWRGEHNVDVLVEAGISTDEIRKLYDLGVLVTNVPES
jgi:CoA:oxalate CoA-transferase